MPELSRINQHGPAAEHYWGIILAGGDGTRLQEYLHNQYGESRPKQFCSILGKRSMLRHTIDRASMVIPEEHVVTTIGRRHLSFAVEDLYDRKPHTVVIQPENKETAPGILLPLMHVHHYDPDAVVALLPSDHFIIGEDRFMEHVLEAFQFVLHHPNVLVLLTFDPTSLQQGYGWIEKGRVVGIGDHSSFYRVEKFWEKPDDKMKTALHEKKCVWNTFTLIGTSRTLLGIYQEMLSELYTEFEKLWDVIGTARASDMIETIYEQIPTVNFSHAVLERIPEKLTILPLQGVYWSDWGDERRIMDDIAFITGRSSMSLTVAPVREQS